MNRRLLHVFTTLLLLMCVVVVSLWLRSNWRRDNVGRERFVKMGNVPTYDQVHAYSSAGTIEFGRFRQQHLV